MLLWCPPDLLEEESPLQDALSPPLTLVGGALLGVLVFRHTQFSSSQQ